jgi:hypothetical protein
MFSQNLYIETQILNMTLHGKIEVRRVRPSSNWINILIWRLQRALLESLLWEQTVGKWPSISQKPSQKPNYLGSSSPIIPATWEAEAGET